AAKKSNRSNRECCPLHCVGSYHFVVGVWSAKRQNLPPAGLSTTPKGTKSVRSIFEHITFSLLTGVLTLVVTPGPTRAADNRPNIVHIVADDLGWKDVGFNGCTDFKTPNIDSLAAGGAKLSQFYVQPMCTPTRAALMTGRYPFRNGLQTIV